MNQNKPIPKNPNKPKTGQFCNICGKRLSNKKAFTFKYVSIANAYVCESPDCIEAYKNHRVPGEKFDGFCSGCGEKITVDFSTIPVKSTHNHRVYKIIATAPTTTT